MTASKITTIGPSRRRLLNERLMLAETRLIAEAEAHLLLEEFDEEDAEKTQKLLKKLGDLKAVTDGTQSSLPLLRTAILKASDEVKEFTGGGLGALIKKGIESIAKKFGVKIETNPILKSIALLSVLEAGFDKFSDLVKKEIPEYDPAVTFEEQLEDEATSKKFIDAMAKLFQESGEAYSKVKSLFGGKIPYVDNVEKFVEDFILLNGEDITKIVKVLKQPPSIEKEGEELIGDIIDSAKDAGGTGGGSPKNPSDSQEFFQAVGAIASEKGNDKAKEQIQQNPKKFAEEFFSFVSKKSEVDVNVVKKVLSTLTKGKMLKTNLPESRVLNSPQTHRKVVLTASQVKRAHHLYIESGCSSRRWKMLLSEASVIDDIVGAFKDWNKHVKEFKKLKKERKRISSSFEEVIKALKSKTPPESSQLSDVVDAPFMGDHPELGQSIITLTVSFCDSSEQTVKTFRAVKGGEFPMRFIDELKNGKIKKAVESFEAQYNRIPDDLKKTTLEKLESFSGDESDAPDAPSSHRRAAKQVAKQITDLDVAPADVIKILDAIKDYFELAA